MGKCLSIALLACCPSAWALDQAELAALLEEARVEMRMPGLRAAVRFPDGRIVRAATGLADREANVALDDTIRMPGGSTGKTFVAALTMLLVEDGVLSLDDPASKWVGGERWYKRLPNATRFACATCCPIRRGSATTRRRRATAWDPSSAPSATAASVSNRKS